MTMRAELEAQSGQRDDADDDARAGAGGATLSMPTEPPSSALTNRELTQLARERARAA